MTGNKKKENLIKWLHIVITLFFMFGLRFLPPIGSMDKIGMQVLGAFIGTLWGWIFVDIGWPSLMGMVAMGLTDYCTMSEYFVNSFGSQTIMLLMALLFISAFAQQQRITDVIVDFLLTRKCARGKPYLTLFFFLLAAFVATLLSQCLAMTILFISIFRAIMDKTGMKPYTASVNVFLVGLSFSTIIGDIAFPFKNASVVGLAAFQNITGIAVNGAKYTIVAMPLCMIFIISYVLLCKYVLRVDLSMISDVDLSANLEEVTTRKKMGLFLVIIALSSLLLPGILPSEWAFTQLLSRLGLGGMAFLAVVILCIVQVEGEPLLDFKEISGYYPWKVLFVSAHLVPLAAAISSDAVGVKEMFSNGFLSLADGMPVYILVALTVFTVCLITNIANNIVVGTMFITIGCSVCQSMGALELMIPLTVLIVFASNISLMLPSACPVNCIIFGQKDLIKIKDQMMLGIMVSIMFCVILTTVGYLLAMLVF